MRDSTSLFGLSMARQVHRRWLVIATYLSLMVVAALLWMSAANRGILLILLATILNGFVLGGYGRGGLIKPFLSRTPLGAPTPWHNDERELHARDRSHFQAYRFVVALVLLGYVLGEAPFQHPQLGRTLILGGIVLGLTLPQALLLWTEPDVEF